MKYSYIAERKSPESLTVRLPSDLYPALRRYASKTQECFIVITMDGAHNVIRIKMTSLGTLNRSLVHPRDVFHAAIKDSAACIIIAHNHPSGALSPSFEDTELTRRLIQGGELLGIPVLDHMIFSKEAFRSMRQESDCTF